MNDASTSSEIAQTMLQPVVQYVNNHVSSYNRPRDPREYDLVEEVRTLLIQSVGVEIVRETFDQNRFIQEARGRNPHAQQYNLNRYFSLQFMTLPATHVEDSQMARFSLLTDASPKDWLTIFKQKILPTLLHYRLPVVM